MTEDRGIYDTGGLTGQYAGAFDGGLALVPARAARPRRYACHTFVIGIPAR